jgi:hypothetical protein
MLKYFLFLFFITIKFNTQAQVSEKCFSDFNLFTNKGIGNLDSCHSDFYLRTFSKDNTIFKIVYTYWNILGGFDGKNYKGEFYSENIKVKKLNTSFLYIFPKAKMPLEKKLYRTANDNRFDTLFSKNDTLYFKKAFPNYIQLSKYFKLNKDTICVVNFYYNNLNRRDKKTLSFQKINNWGTDQKYLNYSIVKIVINKIEAQFVSIDYNTKTFIMETPNELNEDIQTNKIPSSLFWVCIIFRFRI